MSIKIIKPGIAATLQAGVRTGYRSMGIGSSGAMDNFALKTANCLAGNDDALPVIEINFPSPEIMFLQNALISITGADFDAAVNDTAVPCWTLLFVKKNSILHFKRPVSGARAYIAVQGGWYADEWLGSCSTHLKAAAGGYKGRVLQKNDVIDFSPAKITLEQGKIFPWHISSAELDKIYQPKNIIRFIKGIEWEMLQEESKQIFHTNDFIVNEQSDRMGCRLHGMPLMLKQPIELISSATDMGIIQLLPDGNCIVLMADHQTSGGYPRIAAVIKADLPKLAQARAGNVINFREVSLTEAEEAFLQQQKTLNEIKTACHFHFQNIGIDRY